MEPEERLEFLLINLPEYNTQVGWLSFQAYLNRMTMDGKGVDYRKEAVEGLESSFDDYEKWIKASDCDLFRSTLGDEDGAYKKLYDTVQALSDVERAISNYCKYARENEYPIIPESDPVYNDLNEQLKKLKISCYEDVVDILDRAASSVSSEWIGGKVDICRKQLGKEPVSESLGNKLIFLHSYLRECKNKD